MVKPFVHQIIAWQKSSGRHGLPWQNTRDPYRVWLSEIMLQQTQVATVIEYYLRFLERFPTLFDLAKASEDEVMSYWAGLGYYARARHLHQCAQQVVEHYAGQFPLNAKELVKLSGIGQSTAHAILAFCDQQPLPIMDGNVKRVFSRFFGVYGVVNTSEVNRRLWQLGYDVLGHTLDARGDVKRSTPKEDESLDMSAYTQGLMDLGATICTRRKYRCEACPLKKDCYAYAHQQQDCLPIPKPTQKKKVKQMNLLYWCLNHRVYLERRPTPGIWGGLWSFPEFESRSSCEDFLNSLGVQQVVLEPLAPFSHELTHFTLQIQVYFCRSFVQEQQAGWYDVHALSQVGTPKPVADLLTQFHEMNAV